MIPASVRQYLDLESNRRKHLQELFELLRIPSVANNDDGHCGRAAKWLAAYLTRLGFQARVAGTAGKPNVLGELHVSDDVPTLLICNHYDVQPPEPLDLWQTPPFEPVVRDGWICARGADDDKGQMFTHLMAIAAFQRAGGGCPVNVRILIEGEEEVGSPNLEEFLIANREALTADAAVISDAAFFADGVPSITYSLRGLVYAELTIRGPGRDVHSGLYGGLIANPVNSLSAMIAAMHDRAGRVTIPGFYDDVLPLGDAEREAWAALPYDEAADREDLGVEALAGGEKGLPPLERNWARPTLDCNGIVGGYTGAGSKTIIPAEATAKITMRLVPNQDPHRIAEGFKEFVRTHTPAGTKASAKVTAEARPVLLVTDSPAMAAAGRAVEEAFGRTPTFIRCGATVPVTEMVQRLLGLDAVLMGFGMPEDRVHSPNERFRLDQLYNGAVAAAAFLHNLRQDLA